MYIDVWYHLHGGLEIETSLTWAHAQLYGGLALTTLVVASYAS